MSDKNLVPMGIKSFEDLKKQMNMEQNIGAHAIFSLS